MNLPAPLCFPDPTFKDGQTGKWEKVKRVGK
jgi:hypothetical protein